MAIVATGLAAASTIAAWRGTLHEHAGIRLFVPLAFSMAASSMAFLLYILMPWADTARAAITRSNETRWTRHFRSLWGAAQTVLGYAVLLSLSFLVLPIAVYTLREYQISAALGAIVSIAAARALTWSAESVGRRRFRLPAAARNILLGLAVALFAC